MNPANRFLSMSDDEAVYCMGCNKEVYPNDRVMALKGNWHRGCLKCTQCGITLSVRMLESFQNKPYCRAHKPDPRSSQTADSVAIKNATSAPKAVRREAGVKKNVRMTFFAKPGDNPLLDQSKGHAYTPAKSSAPSASHRVQGINKLERRTFMPGQAEPIRPGAVGASSGAPAADSGYQTYGDDQGYEQGGQDQGGYDQGGYDQGGYDQGDQGGYEDQGGYDQGDQGGYDQGDQGGYEDQGGYDQGGYEDQGGYDDQGYDQGGYDQGGYDQGGYDQGGYEEGGDENWS